MSGKRLFGKRILSLILALVLVLGVAAPVQAAENSAEDVMTSTESEISLSATNSFGTMLTEVIDAELEQQQENNGCNIFSIEMTGTTAVVSLETVKEAVLVVAIYDESGTQMIASGSTTVIPDDTQATVEIETDSMPEYFYLRGFLLDEETYKPYSSSY